MRRLARAPRGRPRARGRHQRRLRQRRHRRGRPAPTRARPRRSSRDALGCRPSEVLVASTGVIGVRAADGQAARGHRRAPRPRSPREGGADGRPRHHDHRHPPEGGRWSSSRWAATPRASAAMAKGAGMIAPQHGHHARVLHHRRRRRARACSQRALREAVGASLNRITVDGDTSTNDMAVVLASGARRRAARSCARGPRLRRVPRRAHARPRATLAEMIVRDGEGATRIAEVRVEGARAATPTPTASRARSRSRRS